MRIKFALIFFLTLTFGLTFKAQDNFPRDLHLNLKNYILTNIQEKLYLQTNSNEYNPGDTIWFKASLVNAITHSPIKQEQLFYVDLISPQNKVVERLAYPLEQGFSNGYFPLKPNLEKGRYKFVAYTNYMRNYGEEFIFQKPVDITNTTPNQTNWNVTQDIVSLPDGDSVYVNISGQRRDGREINESIDIRIQLARGNIFGATCQIVNSRGRFEFFAPDSLKLPNVRLKLQYVGQNETGETHRINLSVTKPDLQFLPEGGSFIAGIENKLAFRCVDQDGHPINVAGNILNEENAVVAHFQTEYEGMGVTRLIPIAGKNYQAEILYRDSLFSYKLPDIETGQIGLSLVKDGRDSLYFAVRQDTPQAKEFILLGHCRGATRFLVSGVLTEKSVVLSVPKKDLKHGINTFTLFADSMPQSERLVYIDAVETIQFELTEEKFKEDGPDIFTIRATDNEGQPVQGNFSLLAYDAGIEKSVDTLENIHNYLHFSSDLSGEILTNTDIFDTQKPGLKRKRDLYMLTFGWRRFNWEQVLNKETISLNYPMETGLYLNGEIRRVLTKKPVPKNFEVTAMLTKPVFRVIFANSAATNEEGRFSFQLPAFTDSVKLTLQTKNRLGSQRDYLIQLHSNLERINLDAYSFDKIQYLGHTPLVLNDYKTRQISQQTASTQSAPGARSSKLRQRVDNYYYPGKDTFLIEEVKVKSKFLNQRDSMISQSGQPDVVIESAQLKKLTEEKSWYSSLWDLLTDQVPGLQIVQRPYDRSQANNYNLVIAEMGDRDGLTLDSNSMGGPAVYFRVQDNPDGYLYIFVDRDLLTHSHIPLYDFLSYMDPSEIASINFISKPKNYNVRMPSDIGTANMMMDFVVQNMEGEPGTGLIDQEDIQQQLQEEFTRAAAPPAFLFITTKSGQGIFQSRSKGIQSLFLTGFTPYREFYAPKYKGDSNSSLSDVRKTIYWEPELITDSAGIASVDFFNSSENSVVIQVQGVTQEGETGAKTFIVGNKISDTERAKKETSDYTNSDIPLLKYNLIYGRITDSETGQALPLANITRLSDFYHQATNSEGEIMLRMNILGDTSTLIISSPGYKTKKLVSSQLRDSVVEIALEQAPVEGINEKMNVRSVIRTAIRKSREYYSTKNTYAGYYREAIKIDNSVYSIEEAAFNYSNSGWSGNPQSVKFETERFRRMEDSEGHPLMVLRPNHRSKFYPMTSDVLLVPPEFWNPESISEFEYSLLGETEFGGETCYKIRFVMDTRLLQPYQNGIVYIGKESMALRYASWSTPPEKKKYVSYTRYLHSNPMDYEVELADDFYEASYAFINGKLLLQSCGKTTHIKVNNKHDLIFTNRLSVSGMSDKSPRDLENANVDMLVDEGKSKHMLVKDVRYTISPWIKSGIIKPEEALIRDAQYLHEVTVKK